MTNEDLERPRFPEQWSDEYNKTARIEDVRLLDKVTDVLLDLTRHVSTSDAQPNRPYGDFALEIMRAVVEPLEADYSRLLDRQSDLLRRTANALRGTPPPLMTWSHHDIPELAERAVLAYNQIAGAAIQVDQDLDQTATERAVNYLAAQFDSNLDYMGSEIIRRLQMAAHVMLPHEKGVPCVVCEDDDKQDGSGS